MAIARQFVAKAMIRGSMQRNSGAKHGKGIDLLHYADTKQRKRLARLWHSLEQLRYERNGDSIGAYSGYLHGNRMATLGKAKAW